MKDETKNSIANVDPAQDKGDDCPHFSLLSSEVLTCKDCGVVLSRVSTVDSNSPVSTQLDNHESIESVLVEVREMFPGLQIIGSVRDCGDETTTPRGTTLEYSVQVGMNGQDLDGGSLAEVMEKVRQYRASLPALLNEDET